MSEKKRWFQFAVREWLLALVALGFGIAWAHDRLVLWPVTIQTATDAMGKSNQESAQLWTQQASDGEWYTYWIIRTKPNETWNIEPATP